MESETFINIEYSQYVMDDKIKLLKALANEVRFNILKFLLTGEKCVCEIFPHVKKTQSTVSLYLGDLEKIGVLESRKDGKKVKLKIKEFVIFLKH